ncbi:MAG: hypothetical protein CBB87_03390 [Micavibrio sp. TMED27]|nr:hypothetical protein [Micavibrio sp.]OUT91875.1 MAG: hypothetical protein CBB87_03390 [Micavibrio sp. TMED27]
MDKTLTDTTLIDIKTFFNAVGQDLKQLIKHSEASAPVIIINGAPHSGKSAITDSIMEGALCTDAKIDAESSYATQLNISTMERESAPVKDFVFNTIADQTKGFERIYESWTGDGLSAFFCNSAVLPRERSPQIINNLLNNKIHEGISDADNLHALYNAPNARELLSRRYDIILATNSARTAHLTPELTVNLYHRRENPNQNDRKISLNVNDSAPLGKEVAAIMQNHLHLLFQPAPILT